MYQPSEPPVTITVEATSFEVEPPARPARHPRLLATRQVPLEWRYAPPSRPMLVLHRLWRRRKLLLHRVCVILLVLAACGLLAVLTAYTILGILGYLP